MLERMNRRLVDYIVKTTGIDRETVVRVLRSEEEFLAERLREKLKMQEASPGG